MYLISDIIQELHTRGIDVSHQAIGYIKKNILKAGTHYLQAKPGAVLKYTKRGRTAILKHFKVYK